MAVGDPTERLPLLGAARMYTADEEWQETVDELTARPGVLSCRPASRRAWPGRCDT